MKQIEVAVMKYQTDDGQVFDNPKDAEHYELMQKGIRRLCPECNGYKTVRSEDLRYAVPCTACNKKGWQEKVEVWK